MDGRKHIIAVLLHTRCAQHVASATCFGLTGFVRTFHHHVFL